LIGFFISRLFLHLERLLFQADRLKPALCLYNYLILNNLLSLNDLLSFLSSHQR
jgi:hypothetical protein